MADLPGLRKTYTNTTCCGPRVRRMCQEWRVWSWDLKAQGSDGTRRGGSELNTKAHRCRMSSKPPQIFIISIFGISGGVRNEGFCISFQVDTRAFSLE